MAITHFIPEIWGAKILTALEGEKVANQIVNRDYEGEIKKKGDTVHITNLTPPTIGDYAAHTDIAIEDIDDGDAALAIDEAKYFAFELDDLEKAQAEDGPGVLTAQLDQAAQGLASVFDRYVFAQALAGVASSNKPTKTMVSGGGDAYDLLVDYGTMLTRNDVPAADRWAVVDPSFYGSILKDTRFIGAGDVLGATTRQNGFVGSAAGFKVFQSNTLPQGAAPTGAGSGGVPAKGSFVLAGYSGALTAADQLNEVEAFRLEKRFADGIKGLHLYGAKVTRPTALVAADVAVKA